MPVPKLTGEPIRVSIRRSLGPHLAATNIPKRFILLDREVLVHRGDFERILVHEMFHFVWVRLGNRKRRSWEGVLAGELLSKTAPSQSRHGVRAITPPGELGWSAEWRKNKLKGFDIERRTPAWRRYVCESFCDTAAWLYADLPRHNEYTLPTRARAKRKSWFREYIESNPVSI